MAFKVILGPPPTQASAGTATPPARPEPLPTPGAAPPPPALKPKPDTFAANVSVDDVLSGKEELVPGSQGDAVKKLQAFLGVKQTGLLGPTTAHAIVAFKHAQKLTTPKGADPATVGATTMKVFLQAMGNSPTDLTPNALAQMHGLLAKARAGSLTDDSAKWGYCYPYVWGYLTQAMAGTGYGNGKLASANFPSSFAAQLGEWLNQGQNAKNVGLKKLAITNPYDAPPGALVVVAAGSPGTSAHSDHNADYATRNGVTWAQYQAHPNWPGDISVATGDGTNFINDHNDESYGGRDAWDKAAKAGTASLVGVYVPI